MFFHFFFFFSPRANGTKIGREHPEHPSIQTAMTWLARLLLS